MGYYKQLDIDRQNWDGYWDKVDSREQNWNAIQAECEAIDRLMSPSKHRVTRKDDDYDRSKFLDDVTRHRVTRIVTDEDGSVSEVHQQLVPRFIVLVSMAMSIVLGIAVLMLASLLLLATA